MPGESAIAWTDSSWNPPLLIGCTQVTAGCDNCYALAFHNQKHAAREALPEDEKHKLPLQYAKPFTAIQYGHELFDDAGWWKRMLWPLHQLKPQLIFVNSMSDWLHSDICDDGVKLLIEVMRAAHWHQFQLLTKRGARLKRIGYTIDWPANVQVGVTIEDVSTTHRFEQLYVGAYHAHTRFVSLEPLLSSLGSAGTLATILKGCNINWAIVGAESGKGARPMELDWVRDIRDACLEAGTRFFFKQTSDSEGHKTQLPALDGQVWNQQPAHIDDGSWPAMARMDPKAAGRIQKETYERLYPLAQSVHAQHQARRERLAALTTQKETA